MASFQSPRTISAIASQDLTEKQYFAGVFSEASGERSVALAGAGTGNCIIFNAPASGGYASIAIGDGGKAKLGGTVSCGQYLKSDSAGKLVACSSDNDKYCALALQDGVADDIIEIEIKTGFYGA